MKLFNKKNELLLDLTMITFVIMRKFFWQNGVSKNYFWLLHSRITTWMFSKAFWEFRQCRLHWYTFAIVVQPFGIFVWPTKPSSANSGTMMMDWKLSLVEKNHFMLYAQAAFPVLKEVKFCWRSLHRQPNSPGRLFINPIDSSKDFSTEKQKFLC